jgi:hypothetical protein
MRPTMPILNEHLPLGSSEAYSPKCVEKLSEKGP